MKEKILSYLPGDFPWQKHIYWLETVESTNTMAKRLVLEDSPPHGTVILADRQTGGRGRMGRSFSSPEGGVYMSVILRFAQGADALMHLTCAGAVAACDAVQKVTGLRPGIKWTNDLVADHRKIAGILTELVIRPQETVAIMGIGINCNRHQEEFPPEIRGFAGSIAMTTGHEVDRAQLAAALMESLQSMDLAKRREILEKYRADCITVGKDVSILRAGEVTHAHAFAVADDGGLCVRYDDGSEDIVQSGEVSVRGMYGYI